jgi:cytosine/adenosine deaminase-related metal-dependent hydrolase
MTDVPQVYLIFADAVIPMEGRAESILEPGGVAVSGGKILRVGTRAQLRAAYPAVPEEHIPGIMLPGLVNSHTHLELGYQRAAIERPASFTDWVTTLMRNYPPPEQIETAVTDAVKAGVQESLQGGVTCVGDISRHCTLTRKILANEPLRVISFGEVIGLGKMRERLEPLLQVAMDRSRQTELLTVGLSPHAPYTVEMGSLKRIVEAAERAGFPLTMHLAELREERAFLENATGPLGEWPVMQNILDADVPRFAGGPIRWAAACGLLRLPVLLAHVNYCDAEEITLLAASRASVVYCPRTRDYFGHDQASTHPYPALLAAGVNVCLGTDSLASNPDLSVLREAAFLQERDHLDPYLAFEMITRRGGRALGQPVGVLAPGAHADLAVFPGAAGADTRSTLMHILANASTGTPAIVRIAGASPSGQG